mgnify:CR=1 FL=1
MGFIKKMKDFFFPFKTDSGEYTEKPKRSQGKSRRTIKPNPKKKEGHTMSDQSGNRDDEYSSEFDDFADSRDIMTPEIINSFNEFSQLLHNMNIKMAAQNDQNRALLRSLESLPAIIKDIPRARELEGDILQEMLDLMRESKNEKIKVSERLMDVKSAMIAIEENAKSQISFFEGKERAHRDQMNMMREFLERERKHHRNNLVVVSLVVILFLAMLCGAAYIFLWERFTAAEWARPSSPVQAGSHSTENRGSERNRPGIMSDSVNRDTVRNSADGPDRVEKGSGEERSADSEDTAVSEKNNDEAGTGQSDEKKGTESGSGTDIPFE